MNSNHRVSFDAAAAISAGKVRPNNEDNFYLDGQFLSSAQAEAVKEKPQIYKAPDGERQMLIAVCDGMGGEEYGEVASFTAAASMKALDKSLKSVFCLNSRKCIDKFIDSLNKTLLDKCRELGAGCIGTTLAIIYIDCDGALIASVGDSRIYQIRGSRIRQLTLDHTELQYYLSSGMMSPDEAVGHPAKHRLLQYLGMPSADNYPRPHFADINSVMQGDIFIACSDGLTDMLSDSDIVRCASQHAGSAASLAEALVNEALDRGGRDNVTTVAILVK